MCIYTPTLEATAPTMFMIWIRAWSSLMTRIQEECQFGSSTYT